MTINLLLLDELPKALDNLLRDGLESLGVAVQMLADKDEDQKHRQLNEADVIIHSATDLNDSLLDQTERLSLVLKYQMRPGKITPRTYSKGIRVIQIPCIALFSVAEFAVMMMLNLSKEFLKAYHDCQKRTWLPELQPVLTTQNSYPYNWVRLQTFNSLYGRTVGIIGLGTIGQTLARMLRPFQARVVYNDLVRLSAEDEAELGVEYLPLSDLMAQSDFISIHLRLTDQNTRLIGADEIAKMKTTAFLINTSRGWVLDEEALTQALQERKIAGAALDVFWYEPLPVESPLWNLDNLVLTPHVAGIPLDANADKEAMRMISAVSEHFKLSPIFHETLLGGK